MTTGPIFNLDAGKGQPRWGDIIPSFTGFDGLNYVDGEAWIARLCKRPPPTAPAILLEKTASLADANNNGWANAGETITYSFLVTNMGNVTLNDVEVFDPMLDGPTPGSAVDCALTTLVPGDPDALGTHITCTAVYIVTGDEVGDAITNKATAWGTTPALNKVFDEATAVVPLGAAPAIWVDKIATWDDANINGRVDAGEVIRYSFDVMNTGNVELKGVEVTDPLVGIVNCPGTKLDSNVGMTCTAALSYMVTQADLDADRTIINTAEANGHFGSMKVSATDTATFPLGANPAILVDKTALLSGTDTLADDGETITYSFRVTNMGNVTLTDVAVTDDMGEIGAVTCLASALAPTASTTCTAASPYTVTPTDITQGDPIVNTATVTGKEPGGGTVTDMDTVSTLTQKPEVVPDTPAISVVKTATLNDVDTAGNTTGKADAGETITYSFVVTNTGNVTLTDVAVLDEMLDRAVPGSAVNCGATSVTLAPDVEVTCFAAAYIVTKTDVAKGAVIKNVAVASGNPPTGAPVTGTGDVSTLTQKPADTAGPTGTTGGTGSTGSTGVKQKITLKAAVVNDAGGTAQVPDFTLTGSSIEVTQEGAMQNSAVMVATSFSGVTGAAAITNAVVPIGTYFLSESALPSGYSASAWACTGGQLNGSAITVALGSTVECVITNTYSSTVVDLPGVPKVHPASPPAAGLAVDKAAPGAATPTAATPTSATPTVTTLAFTGADPVPLSLLALVALVLGVALTVAGRRQGSHWARE